jgi:hypothetical protein
MFPLMVVTLGPYLVQFVFDFDWTQILAYKYQFQ